MGAVSKREVILGKSSRRERSVRKRMKESFVAYAGRRISRWGKKKHPANRGTPTLYFARRLEGSQKMGGILHWKISHR